MKKRQPKLPLPIHVIRIPYTDSGSETKNLIFLFRFYFNWTLCQCNCLPQLNGRFSKAALVLIGLVCFIIIGITIFETHGIWKQQKNIDVHFADQARKKVSVAVATDTKNPDYHYGVVVDCGSSGSRVYVYFWPPHNGNPKELLFIQPMLDRNLNPVVKKIEPGKYTHF